MENLSSNEKQASAVSLKKGNIVKEKKDQQCPDLSSVFIISTRA